jgi:hypothetical protein
VVYGYLLRLCGGDRVEAWDLTQDSWMTDVDHEGRSHLHLDTARLDPSITSFQ